MVKVSIVGATGYTGAELVRLLSRHPKVKLVALTTQSYIGKPFWEVYPNLNNYIKITCEELDLPRLVAEADFIFVALPHGNAIPVAMEARQQGKKLIDLGADFRFDDPSTYEVWYKMKHTAPDLLKEAIYGLPEFNRRQIKDAQLVANPGCYPTSAILGLAPLLKKDLVRTDSIIIDSKSGVSGAGRILSLTTHYSEINENFRAYNVANHRHTPEIEQELAKLVGRKIFVSFTPHLTPMTRGILSTIYCGLNKPLSQSEVLDIFRDFYKNEPFVRVLPEGMLPQVKGVSGSNFCDLGIVVDPRTRRVIVLSAIDNLIKGASGQAIQNMNIMLGLPETTALDFPGIYP